mmetsp:Transcript_76612/g.219808  ORF Transcript_76612/g.219808 Transcript_76612/m.219808 type:complete len:160 (+) Transcript_76612:1531-2010(+)
MACRLRRRARGGGIEGCNGGEPSMDQHTRDQHRSEESIRRLGLPIGILYTSHTRPITPSLRPTNRLYIYTKAPEAEVRHELEQKRGRALENRLRKVYCTVSTSSAASTGPGSGSFSAVLDDVQDNEVVKKKPAAAGAASEPEGGDVDEEQEADCDWEII